MSTRRLQAERADHEARVYRQLRELIVHGRLAPGSRIIEAEMADALRVSRTPLRAAIQRLAHEGFIVLTRRTGPYRQATIAPLTREDATELFRLVGSIEGLAAQIVCEQGDEERRAVAADLDRINGELRALAASRPDRERFFDLDNAFHARYVEAGAAHRLLVVHGAIKPQIERYMRLYTSALSDDIGTGVREHQAIIDAVARGDAPGADRAVQANWTNAAGRLGRVIEQLGERGAWVSAV